ncbi:MAG TPA: beta-ketoacyl-ACP synthase II [bacterium]|nr:beta-ketoacyl-ACP synthase II [bacterium]
MRRVVITGIGTVTAHGLDRAEVKRKLLAGESGVRTIQNWDHSHPEYKVHFAAEIDNGWFDPTQYLNPKDARKYDRYTHFAVAASKLALEHGKLDPTAVDPQRASAMVASGIGGLTVFCRDHEALITKGPAKVSPFYIPASIANIAAGIVSIETGWQGPTFAIVSACTSSTHQIGVAYKLMQAGMMDVTLAGGAEAAAIPLGLTGFQNMKALSERNDDPQRASRPFDADRDGFVMGEGAAMILMETLEHAQARGAEIIAEIVGFGATGDAFHITQPAPEGAGAALSMANAMRDAGLQPHEMQYINAHGTSTPYNDKFETMAIKQVFGDHAYKMAISSTKSMIGHLLGASGSAELAAALLCLEDGMVHPTINYITPDPDCDLDYVPNEARPLAVDYFLSNSFGFGGQNGTLIVRNTRRVGA